MFGAWLAAACIVLYIEFHCLHGQTADLTAFIKLPRISTVPICGDDDGECSCEMLACLLTRLKLGEYCYGHRTIGHCSYCHTQSAVLTFEKQHKIADSGLFHDLPSIAAQGQSVKTTA